METGLVNWNRFLTENDIKTDLLQNKYFNATVDTVRHAGTDTYRQKLVPSPTDQKILEAEKINPLFNEHDVDMY